MSRGPTVTLGLLLAASAVLLSPAVVQADEGNWLMFGVVVLVVPTLVVFSFACAFVWFLCPPRVRPLAIALCAVPCTPIDNGTFYWPLWSYFLDHDFPGTLFDLVWRTILTAASVYVLVWFIVWLRLRALPPNPSLKRTREE